MHEFVNFALSQLHPPFIKAMVWAMYAEEARQCLDEELLTDAQCDDLFRAYMAQPI